jgi:hypothetical protein
MAGRSLAPGRYSATIVAYGDDGTRALADAVRFEVVAGA